MKMTIPSFSKTLLALDWDSRQLRVLQCQSQRGALRVLRALACDVPADLKMDDPEALGSFLCAVLRSQSIRSRTAIFAVPRQHAVLHALSLPATPQEDVPGMVRFQLAQELPFSIEEAAVDYVVSLESEEGLVTSVIAAAVRYEFVQFLQHVARSAGLKLARIALRPQANLAALERIPADESDAAPTVLFVDLGADSTEINIFSDQTLAFSRSSAVTAPQFDELLLEVTRTLQAYRASVASSELDNIVVAGASGFEEQFAQRLQEQLDRPAAVYQPLADVQMDQRAGAAVSGFSAVIGLALLHGREEKSRFNFLHPKRPVTPGAAKTRQVQMIVGAAALVMLLVFGYSRLVLSQRNAELARLNKINRKLAKEWKEYQKFSVRLEQVNNWIDTKVNWLDEMKRLSMWFPGTEEAYLSRARLSQSRMAGIVAEIEVDGQAKSPQTLSQMVRKLAERQYYRVSIGPQTEAGVPGYRQRFKMSLILSEQSHRQAVKQTNKEKSLKERLQQAPAEAAREQPPGGNESRQLPPVSDVEAAPLSGQEPTNGLTPTSAPHVPPAEQLEAPPASPGGSVVPKSQRPEIAPGSSERTSPAPLRRRDLRQRPMRTRRDRDRRMRGGGRVQERRPALREGRGWRQPGDLPSDVEDRERADSPQQPGQQGDAPLQPPKHNQPAAGRQGSERRSTSDTEGDE